MASLVGCSSANGLIEQWSKDMSDRLDKYLIESDKIAYQAGMGNNHLVSVLIPRDTVDGIRKISDSDFRSEAGIFPSNIYFFLIARD